MTAKSFIKKFERALSERGVQLYYSDGSIKYPEQIVSELYNNFVTLKPMTKRDEKAFYKLLGSILDTKSHISKEWFKKC